MNIKNVENHLNRLGRYLSENYGFRVDVEVHRVGPHGVKHFGPAYGRMNVVHDGCRSSFVVVANRMDFVERDESGEVVYSGNFRWIDVKRSICTRLGVPAPTRY